MAPPPTLDQRLERLVRLAERCGRLSALRDILRVLDESPNYRAALDTLAGVLAYERMMIESRKPRG